VSRSPTGFIPEELLFPNRLADVMQLLKSMPVEGDAKVDFLVGWARTVGVQLNASQRDAVRHSGVDQ
jgi:hypothetical protein